MTIKLTGVGKRYRREWVLRNIDLHLEAGGRYAIIGPNGSGKSTLLRMLAGHLTPSKGRIEFSHQNQLLPPAEVYQHLTYAAPYIELIEEFSLREAIDFHQRFRPLLPGLDTDQLIDLMNLRKAIDRPVAQFSSGMKQRLKLALACCTETSIILLDEPTTNLDEQGADWYQQLLQQYCGDRLLLVASNVVADYQLCTAGTIDVRNFKKKQTS